ncbi:hypothetical protein EVAR_90751_1 [Eumeta japonica]|uniref:Uncharacterized protein n=1 Tax=Eumeta variegata TaxID=151549 RepID=A0A4C1ZBD7_EUMVA|nr:hypothetical protein EVAR_90751_1 [Eumeta japonica]
MVVEVSVVCIYGHSFVIDPLVYSPFNFRGFTPLPLCQRLCFVFPKIYTPFFIDLSLVTAHRADWNREGDENMSFQLRRLGVVHDFARRVRGSADTILKMIPDKADRPMLRHWIMVHTSLSDVSVKGKRAIFSRCVSSTSNFYVYRLGERISRGMDRNDKRRECFDFCTSARASRVVGGVQLRWMHFCVSSRARKEGKTRYGQSVRPGARVRQSWNKTPEA